ncbi:hypothetical protein AB0H36_15865 [Kribbella sp. NPDC050820]|uniref:hypothetical protein n=1 Tax=Kribbella sp. NPDC050820 TaxID=3155408 RepID=UPI0034019F5F
MTMDAIAMAIARGLVAADAGVRARSADEVTDVIRALDSGHMAVLAHLLAAIRVGETDPVAREAQLHALAELAEWHELPAEVFARTSDIPQDTVSASETEYLAYLRDRSPSAR